VSSGLQGELLLETAGELGGVMKTTGGPGRIGAFEDCIAL